MGQFQIIKERISDTLASLPPRDRAIAIPLSLLVFFGGISLGIFFMFNSLESLNKQLVGLNDNLRLVKVLQQEHHTVKEEVSVIEQSLAKNATTDLSAFLEGAANKAGFNPKEKNMQVRERSTITDGNIQEKVFTVNLSSLSTEEFSSFLLQTETAGYPLKIQTSTVKTKKRKGEKLLQLTLDIATFKLISEEG
jgi:hypothetical protein